MDYLDLAFGGFNPQRDNDAAAKFALNVILMEERFRDLLWVITDGHDVGAIEGEPGWSIERRDKGASGNREGYTLWPKDATFHVRVDPNSYHLAHPDYYMNEETFHEYVRKALTAFLSRNPTMVNDVIAITSIVEK